jgi:hypothetical protein
MSVVLRHAHRPWVVFDPNNRDHRRYFAEFLQSKTWGRCPVRFYIPDDTSGDLLMLIHSKLAKWYTQKEFGRHLNKTVKLTVAK